MQPGYQPIKHKECIKCPAYHDNRLGKDRYDEKLCKSCKYNPTKRPEPPTTGSVVESPLEKALKEGKPINVYDLGPSISGNIIANTYKKKLDYIKDLLDDYALEIKGKDNIQCLTGHLLYNIRAVVTNKTCSTCKWHQLEEITKGKVCVNADSEQCTCWTDDNFQCCKHEFDKEWLKEFGDEQ